MTNLIVPFFSSTKVQIPFGLAILSKEKMKSYVLSYQLNSKFSTKLWLFITNSFIHQTDDEKKERFS